MKSWLGAGIFGLLLTSSLSACDPLHDWVAVRESAREGVDSEGLRELLVQVLDRYPEIEQVAILGISPPPEASTGDPRQKVEEALRAVGYEVFSREDLPLDPGRTWEDLAYDPTSLRDLAEGFDLDGFLRVQVLEAQTTEVTETDRNPDNPGVERVTWNSFHRFRLALLGAQGDYLFLDEVAGSAYREEMFEGKAEERTLLEKIEVRPTGERRRWHRTHDEASQEDVSELSPAPLTGF